MSDVRRPVADRKRVRAASVELPPTEPRLVSHSFSFNREGARAVGDELRRKGFKKVWVGEEMTGDDYWHVIGVCVQSLTDRSVGNANKEMVELAGRYSGRYDGWSTAHTSLPG